MDTTGLADRLTQEVMKRFADDPFGFFIKYLALDITENDDPLDVLQQCWQRVEEQEKRGVEVTGKTTLFF